MTARLKRSLRLCAPTDGLGACGVAPERWAGLSCMENLQWIHLSEEDASLGMWVR